MKHKITIATLSILVCAGLVSGGQYLRHESLKREAAARYLLLKQEAARDLAVKRTLWNAAKGIRLTFNERIDAITWSLKGHTHRLILNKPAISVWLKTLLPQGQKSTIEIVNVETTYRQNVPEGWKLSDVLSDPLTATTDPGPWQLNVSRSGPYQVQFSAPIENLAQTVKDMTFTPVISGKWIWENAETVDFYPSKRVPPTTQETLFIDDGLSGPKSTEGQYLASTITRPFITASDEKVVVREKLPETLTLYKNGKIIFRVRCNTAIRGAHTPTGTFYIRSKYPSVEMKGTNPDGHTYDDPHVHWVMGLIGNIAIHGYPRAKYGFPQSDGCVELPIKTAAHLYRLVEIGTPVEIVKE